MQCYHCVLISTAVLDGNASSIVGVELAHWCIPYVDFTGLDAREWHFRGFF